eukprot:scaffold83024_cov37-Tisochrysis_lutea.AAC.1
MPIYSWWPVHDLYHALHDEMYLYGFARKSNRLGRSSANSKEMAATVKPARTRGKAGSSGGKKGKSSKAD